MRHYQKFLIGCHNGGLQSRIQDFPQGGAPTPKSAIIFQFFPPKLHENERIWIPRGVARVPGAPLDPPMVCEKIYIEVLIQNLEMCHNNNDA